MPLKENEIIDRIATHERTISGVKHSFDAYSNPDSLPNSRLPCVLHYPPAFQATRGGHHNRWTNTIQIVSVLFVSERQAKGGSLKFLDNDAMPFLQLWREKFQDATVVRDLLSVGGNTVKAYLDAGEYGAGGALLTHNGIEYIGCVFRYTFVENC